MLRLRLFQRDDPTNQIDARMLDEGELSIGRDAKANWAIADPDRAISRTHLIIANKGGLVTLRDVSSNGVYIGTPRQRIERERPIPIGPGESIQFGNYLLVVEEEQRDDAPSAPQRDQHSPFEATGNAREAVSAKKRKPFDAAIRADPLAERGPIGNQDAWETPPEAPAGSWNPVAPHRKPDHSTLIGKEREWAEPEAESTESGFGFDAPFSRPILQPQTVSSASAAIPSDWMNPSVGGSTPAPEAQPSAPAAPALPETGDPARTHPGDNSHFFEHFCAGAGLDPKAFAMEDRGKVMERLGAVYRQAVLGIADLMKERTAVRSEYRMARTTVRPQANNPFKWVPPQRLAIELLSAESGGYTTGEKALNEALFDVKAHLLCMLAGMRTALSATFDALSPAAVEAAHGQRNYLIKTQRDAALWNEYVDMADRLRADADDSADGLINRAFRRAYEAQAAELEASRQW